MASKLKAKKEVNRLQVKLNLLKKFNQGHQAPLELVQSKLEDDKLILTLINFIGAYPTFARKLFDTHGNVLPLGTHLGRGEVLVWFLYDDITLGGSSSSIDVLINNQPRLEIKCATHEADRYSSFRLGIDEVPASLRFFYRLLKLFVKNDKLGKLLLPQNFANISKYKLEELKLASAASYKKAEEKYFEELITGPIGKKKFLIFDKDTNLPIFFGYLKREHLKIERISGGLTRISFKS